MTVTIIVKFIMNITHLTRRERIKFIKGFLKKLGWLVVGGDGGIISTLMATLGVCTVVWGV